jgi:predicted GIY-YIG superfamily endonuclease
MTTSIYILKLEHGCYYVGKTNNIEKRINQHKNGEGALWTKIHKVISTDKIIHNCSSFDEDKEVKQYMDKYGINKVRGASYVTKDLTEEQYKFLTEAIRGANDACTRCGRKNHFIKDCYAKIDINNNIIDEYIYSCDICNKEFDDENQCIIHMNKCNILNEKYNCIYCNKEFNTKKGGVCHQNLYCKFKPNKNNFSSSDSKIVESIIVQNNSLPTIESIFIKLNLTTWKNYSFFIDMYLHNYNINKDMLIKVDELIIFHKNIITKYSNIDEQKVLLLYLIKYNNHFEYIILHWILLNNNIYPEWRTDNTILNNKLKILHLILLHNVDIVSILTILLILYNGFEDKSLNSRFNCHVKPQNLHLNIFTNINILFINALEYSTFDNYELKFYTNYEEVFMNPSIPLK